MYQSSQQRTLWPNEDQISRAVASIKEELAERLKELRDNHQLLEAQRLEQRTNYDIEMLLEMGTVTGLRTTLVIWMVDVQDNHHILIRLLPERFTLRGR